MNWIVETTIRFFIDNFPPWGVIIVGGPVGLVWAFTCLYFAGYMKVRRGVRTNYTRKIFHFLIFSTVVVLQVIFGRPTVCLFGGMTSLVIFYAIFRGSDNFLYEAIAREKDVPHRTYFIIAPYFATLIGGLTSNILFGEFAVIGYLVTGLGDAIGEPVGVRFGKHKYRVPSLTQVKSTRSYEGSAAVFLISLLAIATGTVYCLELIITPQIFLWIFLTATLSAVVEAISPHGWDNATLQIIPSLMANYLF